MPTNQQMAKEVLVNYARHYAENVEEFPQPEDMAYNADMLFDLCIEDVNEMLGRIHEKCVALTAENQKMDDEMAADIVIRYLDETGFFED